MKENRCYLLFLVEINFILCFFYIKFTYIRTGYVSQSISLVLSIEVFFRCAISYVALLHSISKMDLQKNNKSKNILNNSISLLYKMKLVIYFYPPFLQKYCITIRNSYTKSITYICFRNTLSNHIDGNYRWIKVDMSNNKSHFIDR